MKDALNDNKESIGLKMVEVAEEATERRFYAAHPKLKKRKYPWIGRLIKQAAVLAGVALLSIACYYGVSHYFVETVEVVGKSMAPTLQESQHYILNRWTFHTRAPKRGDIIVLRDPEDHGISVKRIIATEGQEVHFVGGKVLINGHELNEPYVFPKTPTFTYNIAKEQVIICGKNQYFVMGDNRVVSIDSRTYGPISSSDILGLLVVR